MRCHLPTESAVERALQYPQTSMEQIQQQYLQSMILRNCSDRTIEYWVMNLRKFNVWCYAQSIDHVMRITLEILDAYRRYLFQYRSPRQNRPLKFSTQACYLLVIRRWIRWLHKQGIIQEDVAADLELPKKEERLPVDILTADEVEWIMQQTNVDRPLGLRDRVILETLYSTGIRASEAARLHLGDVDPHRNVLIVRRGKGKKDRVVPISGRAMAWISRYVAEVRPRLISQVEPHSVLLVTATGIPISRNLLPILVKRYMNKAGIQKPGSCHLLRHTVATLMLERGADLRSLQQFLGHARLTTTQIYTHVSIQRLQDVHRNTHPGFHDPQDGSCDLGLPDPRRQ